MKVDKEVFVSTWVEVDLEIELDDAVQYIEQASEDDLVQIVAAVHERQMPVAISELDSSTIRHLIERVNMFGLQDMLNDLKREGERIGVYLKAGCN